MNEQWLTIVEYARACNVSDMTVRRRIRNGKLNAILREGKYLIPLAARPSPTVSSFQGNDMGNAAKGPGGDYRPNQAREQGVIKNHPAALATVSLDDSSTGGGQELIQEGYPVRAPFPSPLPSRSVSAIQIVQKKNLDQGTGNLIPKALSVPVAKHETVSFEAAALVEFCESMARRLDKSEESIRKEYLAKQNELECKLQVKDLEILQLKQQVEDLQLLVSIIDRSK
jgi:hypothetical protein